MSRFSVSILLPFLFLGIACAKTDAPKDENLLGIPDKPILKQAPSQPLNLTEYTQFKTFVANENNVHLFLPQNYVFQNVPQSGLTVDQKNLLQRLRSGCVPTNQVQKPDPNQSAGAGSVLVTKKTQKLEAGSCPINYSNEESIVLTVIQASETAFATKGDVGYKETLTTLDSSILSVIGTPQTSVNTTGNILAQANQQEMRMRLSLNSASSTFPLGTQAGHSESVGADLILKSMQTGATSMGIALNFTLNVPNLAKPVVISSLVVMTTAAGGGSPSPGQPTIEANEFYVNGSPIAGQDMLDILNSQLMRSILDRLVGSSQTVNGKVMSASESVVF